MKKLALAFLLLVALTTKAQEIKNDTIIKSLNEKVERVISRLITRSMIFGTQRVHNMV